MKIPTHTEIDMPYYTKQGCQVKERREVAQDGEVVSTEITLSAEHTLDELT